MATAAQGGRMRPQTFGDAFREARLAGDKTFEFKGETYSTKTAEEQGREIAQTASGSGRGAPAGRTAADRDTAPMRTEAPASAPPAPPARPARPRASMSDIPGLIARGMSEGADRVPAGRGAGAAFTAAGATRGAGSALGRALAGRMVGRAASAPATTSRGALVRKTDDPPFKNADEVGSAAPASLPELGKGVFRSAREKAEAEARNAKPRVQVEGTKGGAYRGAKDEKGAEAKPEFRSRTADRMDDMEMGMKKGGKVKAYAKGGSVRGAGIAQRGVKKCKIY